MAGGRTSAKVNQIAALPAITHQDRRVGLDGARSLRGEAPAGEPFAYKSREDAFDRGVVGARAAARWGQSAGQAEHARSAILNRDLRMRSPLPFRWVQSRWPVAVSKRGLRRRCSVNDRRPAGMMASGLGVVCGDVGVCVYSYVYALVAGAGFEPATFRL